MEALISTRVRQFLDRSQSANPLPEGTIAIGAGLVVLGVTAYLFFIIVGRVLGPDRYAEFSVLWTLVFIAGPGFMFPLEQEVSRAVSSRRAMGIGGGPVIRKAAALGGVLAAVLAALTLAASGPMLDHLFDGESLLLVGLLLALPTYAAVHLARGTLSGTGRFGAYGWLLAGEGSLRIVAALVIALLGVKVAGVYGLLIAGAPAVALVLVMSRQRDVLEPGPPSSWSELSEALGWLLLGAVLAQGFVNASVPLVKVLADPAEDAIAGQFQAGLIISRVPLFLFQAVQAALLPKLAGLAAEGRFTDFRTGLKRLVAVVVAIGLAATIGGFVVGPLVLRVFFGEEFDKLGNSDIGYLALASAAFMLAQALSQALIALRGHAKVALGWSIAIVVMTIVTWASTDELLLRVALGLVIGALVAVVAMSVLLIVQMRRGVPETVETLMTELGPDHEHIEP